MDCQPLTTNLIDRLHLLVYGKEPDNALLFDVWKRHEKSPKPEISKLLALTGLQWTWQVVWNTARIAVPVVVAAVASRWILRLLGLWSVPPMVPQATDSGPPSASPPPERPDAREPATGADLRVLGSR